MMVGSELFRQEPRAIAMAVGGVVNWIATFVIALGFESVQVRTQWKVLFCHSKIPFPSQWSLLLDIFDLESLRFSGSCWYLHVYDFPHPNDWLHHLR